MGVPVLLVPSLVLFALSHVESVWIIEPKTRIEGEDGFDTVRAKAILAFCAIFVKNLRTENEKIDIIWLSYFLLLGRLVYSQKRVEEAVEISDSFDAVIDPICVSRSSVFCHVSSRASLQENWKFFVSPITACETWVQARKCFLVSFVCHSRARIRSRRRRF